MKRFLKKNQLLPLPVYPILFGVYPVLYLWSANRTQQPAYVLAPVLLATLVGLLAVYVLATAVLRNVQRAALITALLSFFALSYGQFTGLLEDVFPNLPYDYLLPASLLLTLAVVITLVITRAGGPGTTRILNGVAIALVLFPLATATPYYMSVARHRTVQAQEEEQLEQVPSTNSGPQRDIYFIIVDNYGREDALLEEFDFDNSQLVTALEERGFIFPECAQANYYHTAPAIASILNMEYLDRLGIKSSVYETRAGYSKMTPLILNNKVMRKFSNYGYHTVTFRGFMGMIDIQNSDTYVNFEEDTAYHQRLETENFRSLYMNTTVFQVFNTHYQIYPDLLEEKAPSFLKPLLPDKEAEELEPRFQKVFDQNLYAFEALERLPTEIESPKFVYAHLYSAHWPFMHSADGSLRLPLDVKMSDEGYVAGVQFTNNRLLEAIDAILENSETEPVIILQGDHNNGWVGKVEWSGTERVKILSAYYLPDGGDALLREDITPVNNFRLVFKHYFSEPVELLDDISYYLNPVTKKTNVAPKSCMPQSGQ